MTVDTSMPVRLSKEDIGALVGADALKSLENRVRGGDNGNKGIRYEEIFGAHRIARLAKKYLESGADAEVEWQSFSFVDDFVVRRDTHKSFKGYQLKNAKDVRWKGGSPTIEEDFQRQETCSKAEGYTDIRLRLVCSDESLARQLAEAVPESIAAYSKAIHFPYRLPLLELVSESDWLAEDFGYLSKYSDPRPIDIHQVVGVLMGAWALLAPRTRVSVVIEQARSMSPTLVRPPRSDREAEMQLSKECRDILSRLPDFSFRIERGFLHWSAAGGTTKGVLSQDCFSADFRAFQAELLRRRPTSFEEIEGALR